MAVLRLTSMLLPRLKLYRNPSTENTSAASFTLMGALAATPPKRFSKKHVNLKALPSLSVCRGRRRGPKTSTCSLPRMDPHWDHHPQTTTQPQEGLPCRIHTSPPISQAKLRCQTGSTQRPPPGTNNKDVGDHDSLNESEDWATRETSCP